MAYRLITHWDAKSEKNRGWTENFWMNTANETQARTSAAELRRLLNMCKGNQAYCGRMTLQNLAVFRGGIPLKVPGAGPANVGNPPDNYDGDNPVTALQLQLTGATGVRTTQWLRGVPDSVVTLGGVYLPGGLTGYQTRLNNLFLLLKGAPFAMNILNPTTPKRPVTAIDPATGTVTSPGHGYTTGAKVRITKVRTLVAANGVWRIKVIDVDTFQLLHWTPTVIPMTKSNAEVTLQVYIFDTINASKIAAASSHYTGGPTDRPTGKKRKKKV